MDKKGIKGSCVISDWAEEHAREGPEMLHPVFALSCIEDLVYDIIDYKNGAPVDKKALRRIKTLRKVSQALCRDKKAMVSCMRERFEGFLEETAR